MATKTIPWNTGSGNIILNYSGEGDDTVLVSSDTANSLSTPRSQTLTFKTSGNEVTRQVTVVQAAKQKTQGTFTGHPTSYDSDHAYASISSAANGYADSDSTNYATINLTTGSRATTYMYYKFDTSSIPANATIKSVSCTCKCYISNTNSNRIATRQVRLYSGTTAKGSAETVSNSTDEFEITAGTWSRSELNDARIRLYAVRGTNQTSGSQYFRFYGATLTVEYEYDE